MWKFLREKCIDTENTLDYAEIWTVDKTDNKAFRMYWTTVKQKTLQSLTHNLSSLMECTFLLTLTYSWSFIYFLTSISSFTQFFYSILAHFTCRLFATAFMELWPTNLVFSTKLVSSLSAWSSLERLQVKYLSGTNWLVFVAVLGEKLLENNPEFLLLRS